MRACCIKYLMKVKVSHKKIYLWILSSEHDHSNETTIFFKSLFQFSILKFKMKAPLKYRSSNTWDAIKTILV